MGDIRWDRLMESPALISKELVDDLKRRVTLIKYKSSGKTFSRIFFLTSAEDAIHYDGSRRGTTREACKIKDIDQVRYGFTTTVWKKAVRKRRISKEKESLAFSILYHNNRHSLNLLAESDDICQRWIRGLEFLIEQYKAHLRTHHQITDRWIWKVFEHADHDRSGHLNRHEVCRLLNALNIELVDEQLDEYFRAANHRTDTVEQMKHLDKDEFLKFYKYVSCRPELLGLICHFNGSTMEETATILAEYQTIDKLDLPHRTEPTTIRFLRSRRRKSWLDCRRGSTSDDKNRFLSTKTIDQRNFLEIEQFRNFLENEQQMTNVSTEDVARLIARFEPSLEGQIYHELGVDGLRCFLLHDEFCIANTRQTQTIYQDMTRPLTDYFIATSHNTFVFEKCAALILNAQPQFRHFRYLRDNQVYGNSTSEMYIHVLRTGCRAVEMDCYDGDNMEPVVYHGNTLTKPVAFHDVIVAIETQAFTVSPYPLFLNIENHCSYEQQGVMARILRKTFQDRLLTEPLPGFEHQLPSPEHLKGKVLVRSRRFPKKKSSTDAAQVDENETNTKDYHPEFSSLIIYTQIVSLNNIDQASTTNNSFYSISFNESKLDDLIKADPSKVVELTQKYLVRVYPGTIRQDSSNIDPMSYWIHGVQMVALNYQSNEEPMWLQQGFFTENGGCGYRLKPDGQNVQRKRFELRIISGQHLPKQEIDHSDIVDPYVKVSTFGIATDCSEHQTHSVHNNGLNPVWDSRIVIEISRPDLCLILFKVRDDDRYSRSNFLGQACFPVDVLQPGYRHIKLRAKNSDFIHGTLFVHIKIENF